MTEIVNFPIKELTLLENNPRTISKDQFDKLVLSLKNDPAFIWNRPVLVNEVKGVYTVYAGNQRVQAAKKLKWKAIPCIIDQNLPEELIKQRIILDNAHYGNWDWEELGNSYEVESLLYSGFTESDFNFLDLEEDKKNGKEENVNEKKCSECGRKISKKKL